MFPASDTDVPVLKRRRSFRDEGVIGELEKHCNEDQVWKEKLCRYEYLDHPADIQLHSWGDTTEHAIEALMTSMYGYMTDLNLVEEIYEYYFTGDGRDFPTMLYSVMEEALCAFQSEPFFVAKRLEVVSLDKDNFKVQVRGFGESYDVGNKHTQEADIKAITYSNMQIHIEEHRTDLYVIVDI